VTVFGGGIEKTLAPVLIEAPFGYRAELRDKDGSLIASAPEKSPDKRVHPVAVLSGREGAGAAAEAMSGVVQSRLAVTQVQSARDFPTSAIGLAGLDAIVIDDFETGLLTPPQMGALGDFVSLGGALVVAGGAASSRTVGPLPPELAPLRPLSTQDTSLAPLGELVATVVTTNATVTVGEVRGGRPVLGAKDAPPLVVEAEHGAGSVVQLAYDPLSEIFALDPTLRGIAWDQGVARVLPATGFAFQRPQLTPDNKLGPIPVGPAPAEAADPARPSSGISPWTGWSSALLVLVAYLVLAAVGTGITVRARRGVPLRWLMLGTAAATFGIVATSPGPIFDGPGGPLAPRGERVLQIETLSTDTAALVNTYQLVTTAKPALPRGAEVAASTILIAGFPRFLTAPKEVDDLTYGTGGGEVVYGDGVNELRLSGTDPKARAVQTINVDHDQPGLEATLRQAGGSSNGPDAGHLVGTVTNHGSRPLYRMRAQLPVVGGVKQAMLADVVAPGATIEVDAPLTVPSAWCSLAACPPIGSPVRTRSEDAAMAAAASQAIRKENQVAVVALTKNPPPADRPPSKLPPIRIAVQTLPLAGSNAGIFHARPVASSSPQSGNLLFSAFEIKLPPGATAPAVLTLDPVTSTGLRLTTAEVFDHTSYSWRPVIDSGMSVPLRPSEVATGTVRVRYRSPVEEHSIQVGLSGP